MTDDWRQWYTDLREVPCKGTCGLQRMIYTTGLFIQLDDNGTQGRYCYPTETDAREALSQWDGTGDPTGPWIKYKGAGGMRRNPNHNA